MLSYDKKYFAPMPDIKIYVNCDTPIALNIDMFELGSLDELIFTIKNYDYVSSPYVFLFRARKSDADKNGEVIFKVPAGLSKTIIPGAFYNLTVIENAFNPKETSCYRKLTDNGKIIVEYGAQDLSVGQDTDNSVINGEVVGVRIEPID